MSVCTPRSDSSRFGQNDVTMSRLDTCDDVTVGTCARTMNRTQGRCALVTGASSGIGEAIARRLASDGLRVFGASRKPSDPPGAGVEPLVLDVTDDDSVCIAIDIVIDKVGHLDVVVNNAGGTLVGALEET